MKCPRYPALIALLTVAIISAPLAAETSETRRIAVVVPGPPGCPLTAAGEAFVRRLSELGYVQGTNLVADRRCYGSISEVPKIIVEVLRAKPDIIVAGDSQAAVAAKKATPTTPLVVAPSSDPVQAGLIASFARPGGNVTCIGNLGRELAEKRLELLGEAAPNVTRIGVLWNLANEVHKMMWKSEFDAAGRRLGVTLLSLGVRSAGDIEPAFTTLKEERGEAVLVMPDGLFFTERIRILALAGQNRFPSIHPYRLEVEAGGLMAYGRVW